MYDSSYSLFELNWNHSLSYLFIMQISRSINLLSICWICMTKKSDSSWIQSDSNVACTVTYIKKRIFSKLACYVTFLGHFVLHMRTGNLISIIKIL